MIISAPKPLDELKGALAPYNTLAIIGCGGCAAVCQAGGTRQVDTLAESLDGKQVALKFQIDEPCDRRILSRELRRIAGKLEVVDAVAENNANEGGGFLVNGWEQENIRSVGLLASSRDVLDIVLASKDGTPVYVADVAEVVEGHMTRLGAVSRDGRFLVVQTLNAASDQWRHEIVIVENWYEEFRDR